MLIVEMLSQYHRLTDSLTRGLAVLAMLAGLLLTGCLNANPQETDQVITATAANAAQGGSSEMDQATHNSASDSVATIRAEGNHLKSEQSLYLKQHAYNPVNWYPWGDEALELARREGKLIFLSIGYSSCHWCHVMEEEVFEDDSVAAYLNEHFVCIKVDREERPDIDAVYMTAVQMMAGRGGWPLNVFLTPQQEPFFGGTYFPVDRFRQLLTHIAETFEKDPGEFREVATELANTLALDVTPAGSAQGELREVPGRVMERAWSWFDHDWGGFGGHQKFPTPPRWRFALHYYRLTGDTEIRGYLEKTLDAMAGGGIYDHIGGGFHRYTVDREWVVPHFEKMLYDNAQLAALYFEAAAATGYERYALVARDTLEFLLREMHDPAGGFYASFDADSGGEEGTYYVWTPAELAEVAGAEDGAVLARLLGVTEAGNFEGANVLTRRSDLAEIATEFNLSEAQVSAVFDTWRTALRDKRDERVAPGLDRKLVTAWNAMAIEALVAGYNYLGEEQYLREADATAAYLWDNHRRTDGSLYRASTAGVAASPAILDDYALFAAALLELFQATGNALHLDRARELAGYTLDNFRHPEAGFFLTPRSTPAPLGRQVEIHDSVEPSGNAVLLRVLRDLAALTGDDSYLQPVNRTLDVYLSVMEQAGFDMAAWHDLALLHTNPLHTVVVAGDESVPADALLSEVRGTLAPYAFVVPVTGAAGLPGVPVSVGKTAVDGRPVAYVCEFGSCQSPTTEVLVMLEQVRAGWRY